MGIYLKRGFQVNLRFTVKHQNIILFSCTNLAHEGRSYGNHKYQSMLCNTYLQSVPHAFTWIIAPTTFRVS